MRMIMTCMRSRGVAGSIRAERLEDRGSDGTSDCRTVSRHTVPVTSHPRVRGTHPVYRPHSPVPGQEERDSGAGSHGEPAPKGSFPPARYYGWGKKAVPATQLPPRSQPGPEFPDADQHD
jgi:hypothetical protein